jgi:hypothetical protein
MFKTPAFIQKMGFSWATCPPSSATSVAIVIILNWLGMFNEK